MKVAFTHTLMIEFFIEKEKTQNVDNYSYFDSTYTYGFQIGATLEEMNENSHLSVPERDHAELYSC